MMEPPEAAKRIFCYLFLVISSTRLHLDAVYSNKENITFDLELCLNSQEEMRTEARRKNLLILILHYLIEEGYVDAANALEQETKLGLRGFEVCDNIDLQTILMEYESYYFVKFQKYPKITKKVLDTGQQLLLRMYQGSNNRQCNDQCQKLHLGVQQNLNPPLRRAPDRFNNSDGAETLDQSDFGLSISGISKTGGHSSHPRKVGGNLSQIIDFRKMIQDAVRVSPGGIPLNSLNCDPDPSERLLKPLSAFIGMTGEMRELAMVVSKDIYLHNPNVKWEDIIGLEAAKRLVKEAVVYPIKYPELFTGILSPWKGLLLYGPPGTGKTLLAKAVATECNTTFFNISASTIVSKWRGDSEKLVRVLFELARYHAPSTIFLDELESVMSQRGTASGGEHEGSRRMKTELLVQMDGLARSDDLVPDTTPQQLVPHAQPPQLQARIWLSKPRLHTEMLKRSLSSSACRELDSAMLRRLEKRILVDLPSQEARRVMIQHWLPPLSSSGGVKLRTDLDYSLLSQVGSAAAAPGPRWGPRAGIVTTVTHRAGHTPQITWGPPKGTLVGHGAEHGTHTPMGITPQLTWGPAKGTLETNGYSGSDIKLVCKEAAMRPVRKIFDALENHQPGNSNLHMIQLDTITTADFLDVITHTKPSAKNLSQKYTAWQREFERCLCTSPAGMCKVGWHTAAGLAPSLLGTERAPLSPEMTDPSSTYPSLPKSHAFLPAGHHQHHPCSPGTQQESSGRYKFRLFDLKRRKDLYDPAKFHISGSTVASGLYAIETQRLLSCSLTAVNYLLPEHLTCEIRQGFIIHQEQGPHLLLLQEVPGCCQGGEDLVLGDVEAQPRQPLQQVPLALLGGVGHKPDGQRGTAQPGGHRGAHWTQAPPVLTSLLLSGAKKALKAVKTPHGRLVPRKNFRDVEQAARIIPPRPRQVILPSSPSFTTKIPEENSDSSSLFTAAASTSMITNLKNLKDLTDNQVLVVKQSPEEQLS
ncbi:hypothetical protein IHE44_0011729 [Lamprotornis superbus]|uniref:Katanin p60 ATPase-containing subunit A-like 2 n=1 Tax=Lamprotornis superbus TaxID=245042 RepID=A0A835NH95_9PASS|nr:hypothetical protein IHE44_0011729 [Lamprotornis superbus]